MSTPDVFFSHDEATIYELRQENERLRAALKAVIDAHETGRFEPLQAALEAALDKLEKNK